MLDYRVLTRSSVCTLLMCRPRWSQKLWLCKWRQYCRAPCY